VRSVCLFLWIIWRWLLSPIRMGLVLPEEGRHFIYFKVLAIWTAQWLQSHLNHYMKLSANNSYKKKSKNNTFCFCHHVKKQACDFHYYEITTPSANLFSHKDLFVTIQKKRRITMLETKGWRTVYESVTMQFMFFKEAEGWRT